MRADLSQDLAEFRREVKAVLDTALSETDAPLAVDDLKYGQGRSTPLQSNPKSGSSRIYGTNGAPGHEMNDVDRELALLEQSNAALFTALAQTRAMPVRSLPPAIGAKMRTVGARKEARAAQRFREATEIQERENRRRREKRKLVERTRDLQDTVSDLERQKMELIKKLEEKRQRRERREADAERRKEARRRDEEERMLRKQMGSTAREAERLRSKLRSRAEQASRARAREALWRWRARAAASLAARERKERLAAEEAMAASGTRSTARQGRHQNLALSRRSATKSYQLITGHANGSTAAADRASSTKYHGVYGGGSSSDDSRGVPDAGPGAVTETRRDRRVPIHSTPAAVYPRGAVAPAPQTAKAPRATRTADEVEWQEREGAARYRGSIDAQGHDVAPRVARQEADRPFPTTAVIAPASAGVRESQNSRERGQLVWVAAEERGSRMRRGDAKGGESGGSGGEIAHPVPSDQGPSQGYRLPPEERVEEPVERQLRPRYPQQRDGQHLPQAQKRRDQDFEPQQQQQLRQQQRQSPARAWRANRAERAQAFAQSIALILRAEVRARDERRVRSAFSVLRKAGVEAKAARERREAQEAHDAAVKIAAVAAGTTMAVGILGRSRRRSLAEAFRLWGHSTKEAKHQLDARQVSFRRVMLLSIQRSKEMKRKGFQYWRLAAATATLARLRQEGRKESIGRGASLAEAVLRRHDRVRLLAGFRRWRIADAMLVRELTAAAAARDRRVTAARKVMAVLRRCRRSRLQEGFRAMAVASRVATERRQRIQGAGILAASGQRAARTLLLTRCWGVWKTFAVASGSARRLEAAGRHADRVDAERKQLRAERSAWMCKMAVAEADRRRKARAWRAWHQGLAIRKKSALAKRNLLKADQRSRVSRLRFGIRRWRDGARAAGVGREKKTALVRSRAVKLVYIAARLGVARTPRTDVARAFRTWSKRVESDKVESLQKRQAARILVGMLRSWRRDRLARTMDAWRAAAARRRRDGIRVLTLAVRAENRQRIFYLSKAWSRMVWAASEREAARARQLSATRAVYGLLASSARAARRRAWLKWRRLVADTAVSDRLVNARRAALQRCTRAYRLRNTRKAWTVLRSRVQLSRAVERGVIRLVGVLANVRQRSLSRGLRVWHDNAQAEAIAAGRTRDIQKSRSAAVRMLASTATQVRRRKVESGWRAWFLFVADRRRVEEESKTRAARAILLVRRALDRARRKDLARGWKTWAKASEQERMSSAVGAATVLLEGRTASLAREVQLLKLAGAVRVMEAAAKRSNRAIIQRGWRTLRQAAKRRTLLFRAMNVCSRSRLQRVRFALHHWRLAAAECRAADARAGAGRAVLVACLAGARRRAMQPAFEAWSELVTRERDEEDDFAGREEGLLVFASALGRVGKRRDRGRKLRALSLWRLGAAQSAVSAAQGQMAVRSEMVTVGARDDANLLAAKQECQQAGARLAFRWFRRQRRKKLSVVLRRWVTVTAGNRGAEEKEARRAQALALFARELTRVAERRRRSTLRRSLHLWHRQAEGQLAHAISLDHQASSRRSGARRLGMVLDRNLLRRKARVWARLLGSAVAASGRVEQDRKAQAHRERLAAASEARASRRLLSVAWLAWKEAACHGRHRSELDTMRVTRGAAIMAKITTRKEEGTQRRALSVWREQARRARNRERGLARLLSCLMRSEARVGHVRVMRCLTRWRLVCALSGRAAAQGDKASAEASFRGHKIAAILSRKRLRRLSEGFRCLAYNRTSCVNGSKEEHAKRASISLGFRTLRRTIVRRSHTRLMSMFARWRCYAAEVGQEGNRALLVSAQRRASAQMLGSFFSRHESFLLSRAWTVWHSGAASAAIHDGERASADLRVSSARHSAGARLLATTLSSARRRRLWKVWTVWRNEVKAAADEELQSMEKHFHLARTLTRVERRNQLARLERAWRTWHRHTRSIACLPRVAGRVHRAQLANSMTRWRLASVQQGQAEAEEGRAAAEAAVRARALVVLVKRVAQRQLAEGFQRLVEHGAWVIYWSRKEESRKGRLSQGVHILTRAWARRKERCKLSALAQWRFFVSESRRDGDKKLSQAAGKRAAAKALAGLVNGRGKSSIVRAWAVWLSGTTSAAVYEGERASADRRVCGARRSAGARLLIGTLGAARRRALLNAWQTWRNEAKSAADAELQLMEKHFHLARTITRVERRTQVAKMGKAWRVWRDVVRIEEEAEIRALERNFHVAQTVARVVQRTQERRLLRAWGLWARTAARGWPQASGPSSSFRSGLLAAASRSSHAPSLARAKADLTPVASGFDPGIATNFTAKQLHERADHSRDVRQKAGAVAIRGLLRRADARCLMRSWRVWRSATIARATQDARTILGATRLAEVLEEAEENRNAQDMRHCWRKWLEQSLAENRRLEQEEEAASWEVAEAEERKMKEAAAITVRKATENGGIGDVSQVWSRPGADPGARSPATNETNSSRTSPSDARDDGSPDKVSVDKALRSSALSALKRRLRGESSQDSLAVSSPASVATARSPVDAVVRPSIPRSPWRHEGGRYDKSPMSPRLPNRHSVDEERGGEAVATTPGNAEHWWGEFSSSSSSSLSFQRRSVPPLEREINNVTHADAPCEDGTLNAAMEQDDMGSLELSASPEGIRAFRPLSVGTRAASPGYESPPTLPAAEVNNVGAKMTPRIAAGSPAGSLAYMSDYSPLVGIDMLQSLSGNGDVNDSGMGPLQGDSGELLIGNGFAHELVIPGEDNRDATETQTPTLSSPRAHQFTVSGTGALESRTATTPDQPSPPETGFSNGGGGRSSGRSNKAPSSRSPPYVGGSVGALSSDHGSPQWYDVDEGEQETPVYQTFGGSHTGERRTEQALHADDRTVDAEAFVARIRVVLWRRAFRRWVSVDRDAVYNQRMMDTTRKVAFLRRQQKLRKVVVSALRRQSYAWHVNDASRAMRKWRELVRRGREDDRLSLELSRISMLSPMTPMEIRTQASGQGDITMSGGSVGRDDGDMRVGGSIPSSYRSVLSPDAAGDHSSSRRLWAQAS